MRLVLPVTKHDATRFTERNNLLVKFGGLREHSCLIIHSPSTRDVANKEAERLRPLFRELQIVQMKQEPEYPAPVHEKNYVFYATVMNLVYTIQNTEHWVFLEADAYPTDYGWATTLSNAYKAAGYPFFGNVVRLPYVDKDGNLFYPNDEQMMMGVGIYPPDLGAYKTDSYALILDLGKPYGMNPEEPFDVYLRGEMRRKGWFNTELFSDQWNTEKFRRVEGGFECQAAPFDRVVRPRGGFVPKKALVIHGCKDNTLYELLMNDGSTVTEPPVAVPIPEVPTEVVNTELTPQQSRIKVELLQRLQKGSVRHNILSTDLNIDQKTLEQELLRIGYRVTKPAGWIKPF